MKTNKKNVRVEHSTSQRIWGALALAGLFVCGLMVGWGLNQGYDNKVAQPKVATNPAPVVEPQPKETCAIIEDLLLERLWPVDSQEVRHHEYNIDVYEKLVMNGCSENQQKYHNAAAREREIVAALQESNNSQQT